MTRSIMLVLVCLTSIARADVKCQESPPNAQMTATFKPDVSLQDLVYWVAGFSCKNVVIAPEVAKHATKITILAPKKMTPKQALQLFVDAVESTGLVVTQKPDTIVIKLGPNMPKNCPDLAHAPTAPMAPTAPNEPADPDVEKALVAIKKIDATHYEVPRATVDLFTSNPMAFTKGARVVPAMKDGKPDGIKIYAVRPSSMYARIGLQNGDTLHTINGLRLDSVEKGLEVYVKLRSQNRFEVVLIRSGKPVTIVVTIK